MTAPAEPSPFTRPAFWAAGAVLALVAALAVFVAGASDREQDALAPGVAPGVAAGSSPPTPPREQEQQGAAGSCPQQAVGPGSLPSSAPQGVTWTVYRGVAEPAHHLHGPLRIEGDLARCYARSPYGALIASWQIATRFVLAGDWERVVDEQLVPGPGREAYRRQRAAITADDARPPGGYGQLAAFRFASYTPQVATIQLVSRFADTGHLQVNTVTVVWREGDWRLQLQPDGALSPSLQPLSDLAGFIAWAGV
jgi:hypothetical protein